MDGDRTKVHCVRGSNTNPPSQYRSTLMVVYYQVYYKSQALLAKMFLNVIMKKIEVA